MIEPAAGRLFDIYYQYTAKSDLTALQSHTEEAYKLHERLRKLPAKNNGLFDLDEFLLLKALRNYSVHRDDFLGKAYAVDRQFAQQNKLDLLRVCLIEKKTVRLAINAEPILHSGEQEKIAKIQSQLVDFGEYFNIEPIIFNFMVKVYEKLVALKLNIPGAGFTEIHTSYKNEIYHNYPHYVSLQPITVSNEQILSNIRPLSELNMMDKTGLTAEKEDLFSGFSTLDINYKTLNFTSYLQDEYETIRRAVLKTIITDSNILLVAKSAPKHIGVALVNTRHPNPSGEVLCFNISKQRDTLQANGIDLDSVFYETTAYELLVLYIFDNKIFPVVIYKNELIATQKLHSKSVNRPQSQAANSAVKLSRNKICLCGSGKKYKKCCLQ